MSFLNSLPGLITDIITDAPPDRRLQRIQQENERNNLSVVAKLILNTFLDATVRGSRTLDIDTQELVDLLVILEKSLWHGLKAVHIIRAFGIRKADDELWSMLCSVSEGSKCMSETIKCVKELDHLKTSISKVRAFLRVAIMKKELADYVQNICNADLTPFYEPWAFYRNDNGATLAGSLLALRVFDCNLLLDYDVLMHFAQSIDLTHYVKVPILPSQFAHYTEEEAELEREKSFQEVLDQKHYVEERNRQLTQTLEQVQRKLSNVTAGESAAELLRKIDDLNEQLAEEKKQRQVALEKYCEKRDECKNYELLQEGYTNDAKRALIQIQRKVEDRERVLVRKLENLDLTSNNIYQPFNQKYQDMTTKLAIIERMHKLRPTRNESDFFDLIAKMEEKQEMLNDAIRNKDELAEKVAKLEEQAQATRAAIQELAELRLANAEMTQKLAETEHALEDLGPHLSDSKMQIVMMKEQLVPASEWVKDSDVSHCLSCNAEFTVTFRKHHCRRCGQIFCDQCSSQRINLPSHAKQVRVCQPCHKLLGTLHASATIRST
uniref:FYVE-type domain-containing protein n=1 Tax=Panagrellus redivivus TaxID=6233 RepID=A0A7E4UN34_PANRE